MTPQALHFALHPRSVALIGASLQPQSNGVKFWNALQRSGIRHLHAVNPKYERLGEAPCYAHVKQIPGRVDLAFLAVPPKRMPAVIEELPQKSIRFALIPITDDLHASDRPWHAAVSEAARKAGVRLIGPDSLGFAHPSEGCNLGPWDVMPQAGGVTLLAQSGLLATALMDDLAKTGAGIRSVVVTGLELDIGMSELLRYFSHDPGTKVITLHIEALRDARAFYTALRYAAKRKPVVVLRAGEDPRFIADRLASYKYHTAAGRDDAFDALLERAGAHRVRDVSECAAVTAAFHCGRIPKRNRLGVVANSSAFAALAAGITHSSGVDLQGFAPATVHTLQSIFPGAQLPVNPVDAGLQAKPEQMQASAEAVLRDPEIDGLLVVLGPTLFSTPVDTIWAVANAAQRTPKPVLLSWAGHRHDAGVAELLPELSRSQVIALRSSASAVQAFGTLAQHRRATIARREAPAPGLDRLDARALASARNLVKSALEAHRYLLEPDEVEALLTMADLPHEPSHRAKTLDEALRLFREIGAPVVLKRLGPGPLLVESDTTLLDLRTEEEVRKAWQAVVEEEQRFFEGVLVERFVAHDARRAYRLTLDTDSILGPILEAGAGGVVYRAKPDLRTALVPASRRDAVALLTQARLQDTEASVALAGMLERLADLAEAIPTLRRIVLDPIVETPRGTLALSASVHLREAPVECDERASHLTVAPASRVEEVWSAGDRTLTLRALRENDFFRLEAFLDRLSDETKFLRFHTRAPITQAVVSELTQLNYDLENAWGLFEGDEIRAVVRWSADAEGLSAEFGVVVEERFQRLGLASRLMRHIEAEVFSRGVGRLSGLVLRENAGMNRLMTKLGYAANESDEPDSLVWSKTLRYKDFS